MKVPPEVKALADELELRPLHKLSVRMACGMMQCPNCLQNTDPKKVATRGYGSQMYHFCRICKTRYTIRHGRVLKPRDTSSGRLAKTSEQNWKDPEVARKRKMRYQIFVNGIEYKSVAEAFRELKLPLGQHTHFRKALYREGKLSFQGYEFISVGITALSRNSARFTPDDFATLTKIVDRAERFAKENERLFNREKVSVVLIETHLNGCPLQLNELLVANNVSFAHDVFGIVDNRDPESHTFNGFFSPLFFDLQAARRQGHAN